MSESHAYARTFGSEPLPGIWQCGKTDLIPHSYEPLPGW